MSPQAWLLLGTIVTVAGGLVGSWLLYRQQGRQSRTTDAQQIIDQLQEMRGADEDRHRRELAELRAEVAGLRAEVGEVRARAEARELALFDYASVLRWHIDDRRPPPPPEWPVALRPRPAG